MSRGNKPVTGAEWITFHVLERIPRRVLSKAEIPQKFIPQRLAVFHTSDG